MCPKLSEFLGCYLLIFQNRVPGVQDCHLIEKQVLYMISKPGFCQLFFKTEYQEKKERETVRLPPDCVQRTILDLKRNITLPTVSYSAFHSFIKLNQVSTAFQMFSSEKRPVKSTESSKSVYKQKRPVKLAESQEAKLKQVQKSNCIKEPNL